MKCETITYDGKTKEGVFAFKDVKESLPQWVKKEFIIVPTYYSQDHIEIDATNSTLVEYLDSILKPLLDSGLCSRRYFIEIDKDEIPNYSYFKVAPKDLEYARNVIADIRMPDCSRCFINSRLLPPVKIREKAAKKLDIACLNYAWGKENVLLISSRLKSIFENEGVSGLIYEPAEWVYAATGVDYTRSEGISLIHYKEKAFPDKAVLVTPPYVARIAQQVYYESADVNVGHMNCSEHNTFYSAAPKGFAGFSEKTVNDFFEVEGIKVGDTVYRYHINKFFVTRKVLEILLHNKAQGLQVLGIHLNTRFVPMLADQNLWVCRQRLI